MKCLHFHKKHFHLFPPFRLKQAKDLREALVEKLKVAVEATLSAEERSARMDEMLTEEEKRQEECRNELKLLGEILFKKEKERQEAKTDEKKTEAAINGAHNAIKNLNSKITKLDTDALKQQEILYSQVSSVLCLR